MIFLVDSPTLTLLVLFIIHALLQLLVAAQHFFSVNLANISPHLLLFLNPLHCLLSQSNFLTLIWLYITYIVLLNLIPISALCVFHSVFRRLPNFHLICINFSSKIPYHCLSMVTSTVMLTILLTLMPYSSYHFLISLNTSLFEIHQQARLLAVSAPHSSD